MVGRAGLIVCVCVCGFYVDVVVGMRVAVGWCKPSVDKPADYEGSNNTQRGSAQTSLPAGSLPPPESEWMYTVATDGKNTHTKSVCVCSSSMCAFCVGHKAIRKALTKHKKRI